MKRDLLRLTNQHFDVLVIGGGIHGAAVALETARIGLKTALIERKDFSHATSANSLKIIHGGLRYLQHLNFRRMRESIRSRREMMRIAPHLVKPLGCIMPTYGHGLKGKEIMRVALFLNDFISWDRNHALNPDQHIPMGRALSKEECLQLIPGIREDGLKGAVMWFDGFALNTERLTLAFVLEAAEHDACVANYVQAKELIIRNNTIIAVKVKDSITNETFDIQASTVVNATGPWFETILDPSLTGTQIPQRWAKAVNIIVKKKLFGDYAVGLEGSKSYIDKDAVLTKRKRLFFFVPWRGYTMIGTTYKPYRGEPDRLKVQVEDIEELISEVNAIYPPARLKLDDVTFFHCGLLPMNAPASDNDLDVQLDKHSLLLDHEKSSSMKGLISIKGVKYTTAPQVAIDVRNLIARKKNLSMQNQMLNAKLNYTTNESSAVTPLTNAGKWHGELNIVQHLKKIYGRHCNKLLNYISESTNLSSLICNDPPLTIAEVIHAVREEMALRLSDIAFRRTDLGTAECPSRKTLHRIAGIMAQELAWDKNRESQEVIEVLNQYSPLKF